MVNIKYRITARTYIVVVVFLLLLLTVFNLIDTLSTWYMTSLCGWYIETNAMILDSVKAHGTMYGFVYPKLLFSALALFCVYLFVRLRDTMSIVIEKHWGVLNNIRVDDFGACGFVLFIVSFFVWHWKYYE